MKLYQPLLTFMSMKFALELVAIVMRILKVLAINYIIKSQLVNVGWHVVLIPCREFSWCLSLWKSWPSCAIVLGHKFGLMSWLWLAQFFIWLTWLFCSFLRICELWIQSKSIWIYRFYRLSGSRYAFCFRWSFSHANMVWFMWNYCEHSAALAHLKYEWLRLGLRATSGAQDNS